MEKMENSIPCSGKQEDSEGESKDVVNFDKSLQELRDLSSQLHYAADYCESTFLAAQEKRAVVENTKEYICRAVITVVDHLGCVSANLNGLISETNEFSDPELRINCLEQRILLCEQFTHKLALTRTRWRETLPRHSARFLCAPISREDEKSNEDIRDCGKPAFRKTTDRHEFDREEAMPLFLYTYSHKPSLSKDNANSALVPVRDGLSILSKSPNPAFHFQQTRNNGRSTRRSGQGSDFFSRMRRAKRAM
ncbi:putative ABI family protein [Rosa chinensis]|uniref:Putative ABI family protein n=1 Tax=Rosa chinensis TaxID=74649 RepID=A0A2P6RJF5_ROSCH|nr:probable protein ABIL5 [Rosa chinensis]PRQ46531.1 putative ABI family protein [Rosa chinensis]